MLRHPRSAGPIWGYQNQRQPLLSHSDQYLSNEAEWGEMCLTFSRVSPPSGVSLFLNEKNRRHCMSSSDAEIYRCLAESLPHQVKHFGVDPPLAVERISSGEQICPAVQYTGDGAPCLLLHIITLWAGLFNFKERVPSCWFI